MAGGRAETAAPPPFSVPGCARVLGGGRGPPAAPPTPAAEFKIYFEKRKQGESYTVDHSAQSYVLDPQGRLRLLVRHDRINQDLAPDLRTLLRLHQP